MIPGRVGRGVRLGLESSSAGGAGTGGGDSVKKGARSAEISRAQNLKSASLAQKVDRFLICRKTDPLGFFVPPTKLAKMGSNRLAKWP